MAWSKVKNIMILLLLLVNAFLLVLVGMRQGESRRYQDAALTQAIGVLEQNGIQVETQALGSAQGLYAQLVERDLEREGALAAALLGEEVEPENQGGGLYRYLGSRGQVSIRAGGVLTAQLNPDVSWHTQDPQAQAADLLGDMGVEARQSGAQLDRGTGTVCFYQLWQGQPLFSCQVVFTYEQGRLTGLEGTLLAAAPGQGTGQGQTITLPTALLRFLDAVVRGGEVCSRITAMQPGYLMAQSFSGSASLTPAWRIDSDTADYYLNAVTGELTRVG